MLFTVIFEPVFFFRVSDLCLVLFFKNFKVFIQFIFKW